MFLKLRLFCFLSFLKCLEIHQTFWIFHMQSCLDVDFSLFVVLSSVSKRPNERISLLESFFQTFHEFLTQTKPRIPADSHRMDRSVGYLNNYNMYLNKCGPKGKTSQLKMGHTLKYAANLQKLRFANMYQTTLTLNLPSFSINLKAKPGNKFKCLWMIDRHLKEHLCAVNLFILQIL